MEPVEILACEGCRKIHDQWTMCRGCEDCGGKLFRKVQPTTFKILCWFFNAPKHVLKLLLQDIRETYEKRCKHSDTDSPIS